MASTTTSNTDPDEQGRREERQYVIERMREDHRELRWNHLIRLLEIALISIVGLMGIKLTLDYWIQFKHMELERETRAAASPPLAAQPTAELSKSNLLLLQRLLEPSSNGPAEGSSKQPSKTVSLSAVFGLIDKFVAAGAVPLKEALNLKEELTKNAIEGGKEILVDTAKKLIDKLLAKSKEDEPLHTGEAQGNRSIHIAQYCGATSSYRPPHHHKKSPCSKEKPAEKPTGECKAP